MSNPNSGGGNPRSQFVNIAAASQRPIAPQGARAIGAARPASHDAVGPSASPQAMTNPPFAHAHGAINLTITNGSVNLRPRGPGISLRPEAVQPGQAVLTANISRPGSLHRPPLLPQNVSLPQAINLKIQNPINLRLTGPQANLLQGGKSGATIIGQGPLVINAAQLRPLQGPVMQAVPQSVSGQLLPQGSLTVLPQGAKISGNIPIAQLAQNIQMAGKIPLRAKQGPAAAGSHRTLPTIIQKGSSAAVAKSTVTVTAIQHGQAIPIQMRPVTPQSAHSSPIFLAATPTKNIISSPPAVLKKYIPSNPQEQLVATDLSKKSTTVPEPKQASTEKEKESAEKEKESKEKEEKNEQAKEKEKEESGEEAKGVSGGTGGEKTEKKEEEGEEKDPSMAFDVEASLEWEDGIGVLPGSDIKFRKNEFGMLEMVENDLQCTESMDRDEPFTEIESKPGRSTPPPKPDSTSTKSPEVRDNIVCCKQCGIYAPPSEFLHGGKFCSRRCLCIYNTKGSRKKSESGGAGPGSAKKKKRKISDYDADETLVKIPKIRYDDDAMSTASAESSTTPQKKDEGALNIKSKTTLSTGGKRSKSFSWSSYLLREGGVSAPSSCFKEFQDIPENKNGFRIGMRLEAIDPRHPSHYCVATVVEIRGYRLRLRFDGYSESYDFWSNADSPFIFYIGWSEKNGKFLDPPKDYVAKQQPFDWLEYLRHEKAVAAPKSLFQTTSSASVTPHGFRIGMRLEAVDKKNSSLICVATIADVLGDNVLIHFDGWEDIYDYWCDPGSQYIHPVGWCQKNGVPLSPPKDWKNVESFTWEEYLANEKASVVPPRAFKPRQPNNFEVGQHLEVVDKRNPVLIRAASVVEVESYSIKIHFTGWADAYDYWLDDDSPDIHPCGWCAKTGHPLTPPLTLRDLAEKSEGCPTPGCTGVGHVKGAKYTGHHSAFGCPYSQYNMNKDSCLLDRLSPGRPEFENGYKKIKEEPEESNVVRKSKSPEEKPVIDRKRASPVGFDIVRNATPSQMEKARELLELQQKRGVPLFGKGSGRGRKKTIVRLMRELQELKSKLPTEAPKPQPVAGLYEPPRERRLQEGVHTSVFSPAPSLHPYHDLPLGWEQSAKLLLPPPASSPSPPHQQGPRAALSADDVCTWDAARVAKFVTSLPGCEELGAMFEEQQIDGEALLLLNQADMVRTLDMKLGPALKIHNSILMLKNNVRV